MPHSTMKPTQDLLSVEGPGAARLVHSVTNAAHKELTLSRIRSLTLTRILSRIRSLALTRIRSLTLTRIRSLTLTLLTQFLVGLP